MTTLTFIDGICTEGRAQQFSSANINTFIGKCLKHYIGKPADYVAHHAQLYSAAVTAWPRPRDIPETGWAIEHATVVLVFVAFESEARAEMERRPDLFAAIRGESVPAVSGITPSEQAAGPEAPSSGPALQGG